MLAYLKDTKTKRLANVIALRLVKRLEPGSYLGSPAGEPCTHPVLDKSIA